jgi:hypothetical protein
MPIPITRSASARGSSVEPRSRLYPHNMSSLYPFSRPGRQKVQIWRTDCRASQRPAVVLLLLSLKDSKGSAERWWSLAYRGLIAQWPALVSVGKARLLFFLIIALIGGMAAQRLVELKRLSHLVTVVTIGAVSSLSIPMLNLVTPQTMTEESMVI